MSRKKRKEKKPGYGKLLDAWTPPSDAGEPVGCLATTFTFSSEFFEVECLSRFARLESDPDEDGATYLIEREEKLVQLACAAVLVDQHHCKGARSPRWDLLGVRLPRGLLHAKIALLHWSSRLRLIVSSANLTEDGYRRNQEIFGVIDYQDGIDAPHECLREITDFLKEILSHAEGGQAESPAVQRCTAFLDGVLSTTTPWQTGLTSRRRGGVEVVPVLTAPERPSALESISKLWPAGRPEQADVVSPFFDPPEAENRPARELWSLLRQRGEASVHYHLSAQDIEGDGGILLYAPRSLVDAQPIGRGGVRTGLHRLKVESSRPLHAKCIWLENDSWTGYMIGSSNFTSAGLGLGKTRNFEANLLYLVNSQRNPKAHNAMMDAFIESEPLPPDAKVQWQAPRNEDEDRETGVVPLPKAFASAVFATDHDGRRLVRLTFSSEPPAGWQLSINESDEVFVDEEEWRADGASAQFEIPWPEAKPPPYGFNVHWRESGSAAWWPVNIESSTALPPPDELRNLPLDVLIEVLTSGRPLHKAMRAWLNRRKHGEKGDGAFATDPHKRVDTSAFILQRTRRVSWALRALRERLERPISTRETLMWRLYGPIGVEALAHALLREAKSPAEKAFLLSELALELSRVKPVVSCATISAADIKREIANVSRVVIEQSRDAAETLAGNLNDYVHGVAQEIGRPT